MTRFVVFREGNQPLPDMVVELGSLKPPPGNSVSVVFANDDLAPPIGRAKDFERDAEGAISFDVEFREEFDAREECFSLYINNIVVHREGKLRRVSEGTIRAILFMPLPGFPPMTSQDQHGL